MEDPDFFEFMILHELLFPEEEDREYECTHCALVIRGDEEVEWIDKKKRIFKCPECQKPLYL